MPFRFLLLEVVGAIMAISLMAYSSFAAVTTDGPTTTCTEVFVDTSSSAGSNFLHVSCLVVRTSLRFLRHSLLIPEWITWSFVAAYMLGVSPPQILAAIAIPAQATFERIVQIYQTYLDYRQILGSLRSRRNSRIFSTQRG